MPFSPDGSKINDIIWRGWERRRSNITKTASRWQGRKKYRDFSRKFIFECSNKCLTSGLIFSTETLFYTKQPGMVSADAWKFCAMYIRRILMKMPTRRSLAGRKIISSTEWTSVASPRFTSLLKMDITRLWESCFTRAAALQSTTITETLHFTLLVDTDTLALFVFWYLQNVMWMHLI